MKYGLKFDIGRIMREKINILVTGSAGFIGYNIAKRLLGEGITVVGLDNLNDYYDPRLKIYRNSLLLNNYSNYIFYKLNISDFSGLSELFKQYNFKYVVHMAAQAGVRYSLTNPHAYLESNIAGFLNILECCRHNKVEHLVFASSSSVYGLNTQIPFSTHQNVDHPISLYAASKKSNELMAHSYAHLYKIPVTGLRFFTVYGPLGRPDMAYFKFTESIINGNPIDVYNNGDMERDFTYIDDITEGLYRILWKIPAGNPEWNSSDPDPGSSPAPYRIYNIGNHRPVNLMRFISLLEEALQKKARINMLPIQPGDVKATFADINDLTKDTGYTPNTPVEEGILNFITWFKEYYLK